MTPPTNTPTGPMPAAPLAQAPHSIDEAVKQLAKLPILGPALWPYAKDPEKQTLFFAYTASQAKPARILPPVILEQCQGYVGSGGVNQRITVRAHSFHIAAMLSLLQSISLMLCAPSCLENHACKSGLQIRLAKWCGP